MDTCLARLFHPAMEGGHLAPAQNRAKTKNQLAHDSEAKGTAASECRPSAPAGWSTRRVPCSTVPPLPAATVVLIPSRLLAQVAMRRVPRRSPFGSLLFSGATAKGILPAPSSN